MFVLETKNQLEKAILRAKQKRCFVKYLSFGNYRVKGEKDFYNVVCRKDNDGNKIVDCECKGGAKGFICYHAVAALSLHVGLARQKQVTK
jgi:hypothetical protein